MPVTPTDALSLRNDNLREAIAQDATFFQVWTGTASTAAARARIAIGERGTQPTLPYAHITEITEAIGERVGISTSITRTTHRIVAYGTIASANQSSEEDASIDAANQAGGFFEMLQRLGQGTTVGTSQIYFSAPVAEPVSLSGNVFGFDDAPEQDAGEKKFTAFQASYLVRMGAGEG